jgi:putative membrane protein
MTEKAKAAEHVKTAKIERAEIRKTTGKLSDQADRTTELAADRTLFAAERTYAAWVRTGLAALASGVGAKALLTGVLPMLVVKISGTILIPMRERYPALFSIS